jgi:predicted nucleic acid-binding Zn ribbon protein
MHGVHGHGPESCPNCGSGPIRKAVSAPAVHFKGSGWAKKERHASTAGRSKGDSDGAGSETGDKAAAGSVTGSGSDSTNGSGDGAGARDTKGSSDAKSPGPRKIEPKSSSSSSD